MPFLLAIFGFTQAIGAIIGAGGAVFAELFYIRAIRDGRIDEAEAAHLRVIAYALRVGMMVVLISSIGLVVLDYTYNTIQPALTACYWSLMLISLAVIIASWAISRKKVSFTIGSALVFSGWWIIAYLTLGRFPALSLGATLMLYVIFSALIAALLFYARMIATSHEEDLSTPRAYRS